MPQLSSVACSILDARSPDQFIFIPDWMMKALRLKPRCATHALLWPAALWLLLDTEAMWKHGTMCWLLATGGALRDKLCCRLSKSPTSQHLSDIMS